MQIDDLGRLKVDVREVTEEVSEYFGYSGTIRWSVYCLMSFYRVVSPLVEPDTLLTRRDQIRLDSCFNFSYYFKIVTSESSH